MAPTAGATASRVVSKQRVPQVARRASGSIQETAVRRNRLRHAQAGADIRLRAHRHQARILKLSVEELKHISQGSTIQGVTKRQLAKIQIPLPPLEVQREIVAEIEGYQKVIDGARAMIQENELNIQYAIDKVWKANDSPQTE